MTQSWSIGKEIEFIYKGSPHFGKHGIITGVTEGSNTQNIILDIEVKEFGWVEINDVAVPLDEQIRLL